MDSLGAWGRALMGLGCALVITGAVMYGWSKISGIDRMPGDIFYRKGNFSFFFPLGTCILISLVATILVNFFGRK